MYSTFHSFTAGKMLYNEVSQLSLLWFTFLLTQHPFKTDAFSFLGLLHEPHLLGWPRQLLKFRSTISFVKI